MMKHYPNFAVLLMALYLLAVPVTAPQTVRAVPSLPKVLVGGVPKYWGETRDYDTWFSQLAAAGVTAFLPFSEYQELPDSLYLGYESDFLPPCRYDSPAFQALRKHHMQLIAAGELLYANGYPPLDQDPLRALITCAGEGTLAAVLSVDEPAKFSPEENADKTRRIYERVKMIAPNIPVMMVHAPIPIIDSQVNAPTVATQQTAIETYLTAVKSLSTNADIIGFDIYPIPPELNPLLAPDMGIVPLTYQKAFPAYLNWAKTEINGKPLLMALQAFSYQRLLAPESAIEANNAGYDLPFPSQTELQDMACLAFENGASQLAWWGQSALLREDEAFWNSVLDVTRAITTDPAGYCAGRSQR